MRSINFKFWFHHWSKFRTLLDDLVCNLRQKIQWHSPKSNLLCYKSPDNFPSLPCLPLKSISPPREREEGALSFISMESLQHGSSFSSLGAYLHSLSQTPARLARRAFSVSTSYEEMSRVRSRSGSNMAKTLRWPDLVGFGLGGMVGAGIFVTTGRAARVCAGPAVVVSYAIAGLCALLSAFCYTEFAVDMPVAGGAFSYLRVTFGEIPPIEFPSTFSQLCFFFFHCSARFLLVRLCF